MSEEQSALVSEEAKATEQVTESTETTGFIDSLPDDLKNEPSLKDFKDLSGLAKSYVHAQRMLGGSVRIPSEEAGKEQLDEFYSKLEKVPGVMRKPDFEDPETMNNFFNSLGRPETKEGYDIKVEGPNSEFLDNMSEIAHKAGLTKTQFQALAHSYLEKENTAAEEYSQYMDNSRALLQKEWGVEYNNRLDGAKAVLDTYRNKFPEAVSEIENTKIGSNPAILSMLATLGKSLKESGHKGPVQSTTYGITPEEARAQIKEIYSNRSHPYHTAQGVERRTLEDKMIKLQRIARSG